MEFHQKTVAQLFKEWNSSEKGLTNEEANKRLLKFGPNEIQKQKTLSLWKLLWNQVANFIIYVLIGAAVVSALIGETTDAIIIFAIVILNILFGFAQEYKAEKAIESLRKLSSPKTLVLREGKVVEVPSKEIVPGDILVIEEGSHIPADARVIESISLEIDESTFTGESIPAVKHSNVLEGNIPVSDRNNCLFAGTVAVKGRGKALVINTGSNTELGKIAEGIQESEEHPTPLQLQLKQLGIYITVAILIICAIIFLAESFRGEKDAFLTSIALAVAAIPEGLPAVITITLALGTQRMIKKNALIRKLPAVEALGSTTVICTDKTGTLTLNKMTVTELFVHGKTISVSGEGYDGEFHKSGKKLTTQELSKYSLLFESGWLCNNATLEGPSDPTEKAILFVAKKADLSLDYERIEELPFSSENKYMITINQRGKKKYSYIKGAPEIVLALCNGVETDKGIEKLTGFRKKEIFLAYDSMASKALRVLAFGYNPDGKKKDFVFVGLMGMKDPPRPNVKESISQCKDAGIKVVMITGDHVVTAKAIAEEIGIKGETLTGKELEEMSDSQLDELVEKIGIFARVSPIHKSRIVKAFRRKGHIIAMTGDGVNDAPALKLADIGTAIGSGTDVAKEASSMILTDDNFVSIVSAIKEGRGVYANIKKFVNYLFSCNLGEVLVIFLGLILGLPLPLLAIQILMVNLLTDGLPALVLGVDPIDVQEIMKQPPRKKNEFIINRTDALNILFQSIIITAGILFLFTQYLPKGEEYARTIAFSTLVLFQLFNSLNYRVGKKSIFSKEFFANKYLLCALLLSFLFQLAIVYLLNDWFYTVPLTLEDWGVIALVSVSILLIYELIKFISKTGFDTPLLAATSF